MLLRSHVEQLLLASVDSVEQCEILDTMRLSAERWWTARDLARELYLSESPTGRDLEVLATRGLLEVRLATELQYRVAPASGELAQAVAELGEDYCHNWLEVLN